MRRFAWAKKVNKKCSKFQNYYFCCILNPQVVNIGEIFHIPKEKVVLAIVLLLFFFSRSFFWVIFV